MSGIVKRYPGVLALDNVSFSLEAGEVHCLVGENGAGKSTLMKILSGAVRPDRGTIAIDGTGADILSPRDAQQLGIALIYQDFKLVPGMSVAENIFLGREPTGGPLSLIDRHELMLGARKSLAVLGEEIDPTATIESLSVAQRQIVEIARALARNARILALDEPTAPLTEREVTTLFAVIRRLRAEGVGIIYISHRLEEVFALGDRVTVLRDGKGIVSAQVSATDRRQLIRWMVGRELENEYPRSERRAGAEILRVEGLRGKRLGPVSFSLARGEILGLAGLVGAGRSRLARIIFGAEQPTGGAIFLDGEKFHPRSPHEAIAAGIALLTEDRNTYGLVSQMSVRENITLASIASLVKGPFIDASREELLARQFVRDLRIRPENTGVTVESLSGGNRQKVVLARWLASNARVLIFDEPTSGIDVGVKFEIYTIINRLAREGLGILVISSDLPELLGICHRIAVMCEGTLTGIVERETTTQETIMTLATHRSGDR